MSDWQASASLDTLRQRAMLYRQIRDFFAERNVLEVETPLLSRYGVTDIHTENITAGDQLLQTSPEYAMKRLLARDGESIFQLGKAFRKEECGRRHQCEFTMLEWYRVAYNHHQLMDEVDDLLGLTLNCDKAERCSYQTLFRNYLDLDPLDCSLEECLERLPSPVMLDDKNAVLSLLMGELIEPQLGKERPLFVTDYPASQSALAKLSQQNPLVAERFEVYFRGMELANGFHELTDAAEQQQRFLNDQAIRKKRGLSFREIDPYLMAALKQGLPDCAGVALGIDRLLMVMVGAKNIRDVISFP